MTYEEWRTAAKKYALRLTLRMSSQHLILFLKGSMFMQYSPFSEYFMTNSTNTSSVQTKHIAQKHTKLPVGGISHPLEGASVRNQLSLNRQRSYVKSFVKNSLQNKYIFSSTADKAIQINKQMGKTETLVFRPVWGVNMLELHNWDLHIRQYIRSNVFCAKFSLSNPECCRMSQGIWEKSLTWNRSMKFDK